MAERGKITRRTVLGAAAGATVAGVAGVAAPAYAGSGPYRYPVTPGGDAWARLLTFDDMARATRLPDGLAARMPTDALLESVLEHPLLMSAVAYNSVQRGIESIAARVDVVGELLRRPDAGPVLLKRYAAADVRLPRSATLEAAGAHVFELWKLEVLLAQPPVLRTLSAAQLEAVLRVGRATYAVKSTESDYGTSGLAPTSVLLGRALGMVEGWDWRRSDFLAGAPAATPQPIDEVAWCVDRHAREPGKAHPVGSQMTTMDHLGTVYTPRGTPVTIQVHTFELTPAEIARIKAVMAATYPLAIQETEPSRTYNCHAFAWYSSSPFGNVWMNTPGDDVYWLDSSYLQWTGGTYRQNMNWSWRTDDHSGGEVGTSGTLLGKWGVAPRMRHPAAHCPYSSGLIYKYYRNW